MSAQPPGSVQAPSLRFFDEEDAIVLEDGGADVDFRSGVTEIYLKRSIMGSAVLGSSEEERISAGRFGGFGRSVEVEGSLA